MVHYKVLCIAAPCKISIKRHPFICIKSTSEDERRSGGWVVCMCMVGELVRWGSHMRDTEQTENHPELSNPGMTI